MSNSPIVPMLKLYGLVWLGLFLFALTAMLVSNGVFGVAWFAVADVSLSLAIFVAAGVVLGTLVSVVLSIISLRLGRAIVMLVGGVIHALLPFAVILAFALYAYVSPVSLHGVSFVLEQFSDAVQAAINAAGQALASTSWEMPSRAIIDDALLSMSAGLAVVALIANWITMRRREG
jgi:hypothetical protein